MPQPSERAKIAAGKVLAKCAAYDPYFPKPSETVFMAWAEHITLKNVSEELMLDAVTVFYEGNTDGQKPLPATISTIARDIMRERNLAMTEQQRRAWEDRRDAQLEGRDVKELDSQPASSRERITLAEWEARHGEKFPSIALGKDVNAELFEDRRTALKVRCPHCEAEPLYACTSGARELKAFHPSRLDVAEGRCASNGKLHQTPHTPDCEIVRALS